MINNPQTPDLTITPRGAPDSLHYLYRGNSFGPRRAFTSTNPNKAMLVELRGDGSQTMIPPSIHPSRFTEAQIIGMIKEQEAGMPTAEVCRRHGLSPASFYRFKAKYGGMNVSDTHRLKSLEDENAKLKRLLADTMLDNVVLKDLLGKN